MAVEEYVSVSSQRDSQRAELAHEQAELAANPEYGLEQLTGLVQAQGIDRGLARQVAEQLTEKDALAPHARYELGIDPEELTNPCMPPGPRCWPSSWERLSRSPPSC
jgi:vacuolar iron transporter family protein